MSIRLVMNDGALQIDADHFVAGVVIRGGVVVEAAPILKYMRGWSTVRVIDYARSRGWIVTATLDAPVAPG